MSQSVASNPVESRPTIENVFSFVQFCSVPHKKKDRRDPFTESRRPWFVAADRKPNSVSSFRKRRPFLCGICCQMPEASLTSPCDLPADQASRAGTLRIFGLAAGGVCRAGDVTTAAVRSYRTISPLHGSTRERSKERVERRRILFSTFSLLLSRVLPCGFFLLHFPSDHSALALPSTVPCAVRTFLTGRQASGATAASAATDAL